jgi:hypothetical protein
MKTNRHSLSICILALLLLHATMAMAWPGFPDEHSDLPVTSNNEVSAEQHPCHDNGVSTAANGDKGCVFCGYAVQMNSSRICLSFSLVMTVPAPLVVAAPRPEHPVELPPPKIQSLV